MATWDWANRTPGEFTGYGKRLKKLPQDQVWHPVRMTPSFREGSQKQPGKLIYDTVLACAFCKGEGERPADFTCPVCKRNGTVKIFRPPVVVCAYCKGRGEDKPRSVLTCGACKGKGVLPVKPPVEVCSHCNGKGAEPTNKIVCITCRGAGVTTKIEEGKERFVARPWGTERECLQVILELGRAGHVTVSKQVSISSAYAEYVCESLTKKGLIRKGKGRIYSPTALGKRAMRWKEEVDQDSDYEWTTPWPKR